MDVLPGDLQLEKKKKLVKKENATKLLRCLSMWKCNVRKGIKPPTHTHTQKRKNYSYYTGEALRESTLSSTHAQLSGTGEVGRGRRKWIVKGWN